MSRAAAELVSFVMPVWNPRRDWLLQAVEAVLGQRDCQLELIIVDDGCPEPVEALLSGVEDDRMQIVRVQHGGTSRARNAGVAAATGRFIRLADGDDVLAVDSTARLLQLIGGDEDVIAYGSTVFCDDQLRPFWTMTCELEGDLRVASLHGRFMVRHVSLLFPRRVIEATGDWEPALVLSQDWDFILRALEHATVRGDGTVVTYYRKHSKSTTTNLTEGLRCGRLVIERYFQRHPEQKGTPIERKAYGRLHAMMARASLTHGDLRTFLGEAGRALAIDPAALVEETRLSSPALAGRARSLIRPAKAIV
jgi:glycosyltransferase involved in cell wall biosynthesis